MHFSSSVTSPNGEYTTVCSDAKHLEAIVCPGSDEDPDDSIGLFIIDVHSC